MAATVLAFPVRRAQPVIGQDRLAAALERLTAALAEQHAAIQSWRASLLSLRHTSERLGDGLLQYEAALGQVERRVTGLNAQARSLEALSA